MRLFLSSFLLAASSFLVACSSVAVNTDYDPNFDFSGMTAYAWKDAEQPPTGDPNLDSSLLNERIRGAVDDVLAAKGHEKVATPDATFLVAYHVATKDKTVVTSYDSPRDPYWYSDRDIDVYQYLEGSLILDVLESDGQRLRWRGHATAAISRHASPEEREAQIREAVQKMLDKFPPQP